MDGLTSTSFARPGLGVQRLPDGAARLRAALTPSSQTSEAAAPPDVAKTGRARTKKKDQSSLGRDARSRPLALHFAPRRGAACGLWTGFPGLRRAVATSLFGRPRSVSSVGGWLRLRLALSFLPHPEHRVRIARCYSRIPFSVLPPKPGTLRMNLGWIYGGPSYRVARRRPSPSHDCQPSRPISLNSPTSPCISSRSNNLLTRVGNNVAHGPLYLPRDGGQPACRWGSGPRRYPCLLRSVV